MNVANPWDKVQEAPSPSELNPLTNPILEQNLGRWAKVYFSNPPARREKAVSNLLDEIKRESGAASAVEPDRTPNAEDAKLQGAVCSACRHQNPPGHKFCSRCGATLIGEPVSPVKSDVKENLDPLPLFGAPPPQPHNDVQWLRETAFSGMGGPEAPPRRGWKYLLGAAAIVLAGFAYLQWASAPGKIATTGAPQVRASTSPPSQNSSVADKRPPEAISPDSRVSEPPSVSAEARDRATVPAGVQPASQKSPLLDATSSRQIVAENESGVSDLRLAQRYLGGSMGARDSEEAAKLLWKAVGKQNATAAILLSNLYLRGDGVPRSCAQARILLGAAAKRGSHQAAEQLSALELQGCH
jgi:ribosomal protein L40E